MSRIGQMPIEIPGGVQVTIEGQHIAVKGPKGQLERVVPEPIQVVQEGSVLTLVRPDDEQNSKALHGLSRTLVANLVAGVTTGFRKSLELHGKEFRAEVRGSSLVMDLGFSHEVVYEPASNCSFEVQGQNPILIHINGIDREVVGQTAATIRARKKPEPYKGKGLRYQGEVVRRKAGKAGAR